MTLDSARLVRQDITTQHAFFDAMPVGMALATLDGTIVEANTALCKFLGYEREELVGQRISDIVDEADRPDGEAALRAAAESGLDHYAAELRYICSDGRRTWVDVSAVLLPGAEPYVFGIIQDIDLRKKMEQVASESEERFRQAFENAPIGMALVGLDGRFLRVNAALCDIVGYSPDELLLRDFQSITHLDDLDEDLAHVQKMLDGEVRTYQLEKRYHHRDGHVVWAMLSVSMARAPDDTPLHFISQIEDITARKRHEEALRRAREETAAANRAKSEFLSHMSHELRTPLNSVLGFGQLLQMSTKTPDEQRYVGHILTAGQHLRSLIDEALDLSRVEAGRLEVDVRPVEAGAVVANAATLAGPLAAERRVTLLPEVPGGTWVMADEQRLLQVVLNLVSNAVKYNRQLGCVSVTCEKSSDDTVRIEVHDTGVGIPAERVAEAFEPFSRLGDPGVEGTGLGLAVSKGLVEAMGGTIGIESTAGLGTTVWVELSSAPPAQARARAQAPERPSPAPARRAEAARQARVLYIEDNLANLELMHSLLARRRGLDLLTASKGRHGLDLACERLPDIVLLDVHLPDMHGSEVLREIRSNASTRDIPVVVVSADATPAQREAFLGAGAQAYVTKPIEIGVLLEVLDRALEGLAAGE